METSAHRRLQSIARHLLSPPTSAPHLQPNPLSSAGPTDDDDPPSPVIIGGMVLDVHAKPHADLPPGTTAPGKVTFINGGVGRNVAECVSKLGTKPFMISVLGRDVAGELLLKYWRSAGLCTEGIRKLQDVITPVVSNIFDSSGELAAAVASVEAVEKFLNPDWIQQFRHNIRSGPMLMVDANLNPRSIEAACQIAAEYDIPVWFEPVSVVKSRRIAPVVESITCTFPNENELIAMANVLSSEGELFSIPQFAIKQKELPIDQIFLMLKPAICVLLEKGIRLLIVTLGSNGVCLCFVEGLHLIKHLSKNKSSFSNKLYEVVNKRCPSKLYTGSVKSEPCCSHYYAYHFPAVPASVVSLTGAGDCLVGGIIASICAGLDILQSTAVGIAAAKAAVEVKDNVPAEYYLLKLAEDAEKVFVASRPLLLD